MRHKIIVTPQHVLEWDGSALPSTGAVVETKMTEWTESQLIQNREINKQKRLIGQLAEAVRDTGNHLGLDRHPLADAFLELFKSLEELAEK